VSATVSVIVPMYNGRRFIAAAVDSIVAQSLQPAELILVDDGSTDGTSDLAMAIDAPFPVHLLQQERQGQSAARNRAAASATGTYLAFLDHDDVWHREHLAWLVRELERDEEIGWAYSDIDEIDESGGLVALATLRSANPRVQHPKTDLLNMLSADMLIFPSASVVRRTAFLAVGGFDERLSGYEDDDLFLRLFRAGWRNVFVSEPSVRYRRHVGSSVFSERMWDSRDVFAAKLIATFPDDPRIARFCVRDHIAPRFYYCAKTEYFHYFSLGRWDLCARALTLMRLYSDMSQLPASTARLQRALGFGILERPALFRRMYPALRPVARLPRL
jgi:glycosyltransferase involved in cell wall biosynthesis